MALHPRLGENSPITVDILWVAATYWLVRVLDTCFCA